ncbi:uncharacterized protein LOC130047773 [Ostrea edulis]|uniref:uncharacterized protein LOC130047773 n=1 Tax=Ostrea edulis TaxID=37623 RepID=UPI0024AFFEDA|nr:uncharacterized protein LOC130047773 [Ostrea edulis]
MEKQIIERRVYNVQEPNHLWHIDKNHKLIRWSLIIAGGIDGCSHFLVKKRDTGHGSMITRKRVHNQRIERLWRDVYTGVLCVDYHSITWRMKES